MIWRVTMTTSVLVSSVCVGGIDGLTHSAGVGALPGTGLGGGKCRQTPVGPEGRYAST